MAALDPRPGERILHVGCGTGELTRLVARAVGPTGRVVAVEPAAGLLEEATAAATAEGLPVRFVVAALDDPPPSGIAADAVLLVRALSRGRDPGKVLAAALGALVPGGRAVVAEPDWTAAELDHPDPVLTRRVLSPRRLGIAHPELAGDLARMLSAGGLGDVRARDTVSEARGRAGAETLLQAHAAALAPAEPDGVPAAAARSWWRALLDADAREPIVARLGGTVVTGVRPRG